MDWAECYSKRAALANRNVDILSFSVSAGSAELFSKSSRSWFAISNLFYRNKRLSTDKAFEIVGQLETSKVGSL